MFLYLNSENTYIVFKNQKYNYKRTELTCVKSGNDHNVIK